MTPEDMARIHAAAMTVPPPWDTGTMRALATGSGAVLIVVDSGFALGRVVLDEAELLTLAVDPACQGQGIGRSCLAGFEAAAARKGALRAFLEVAATNAKARALYAKAEWHEVGRRKGYYRVGNETAVDAILMSKQLAAT